MKKYLLGLSAIVLAIAFSAFTTKPVANERIFRLQSGVSKTSESAVQNVANWERIDPSIASCTSVPLQEDQVCEIVVSDVFYTFDSGEGTYSLNATDPAGPGQAMTINAEAGLGSNQKVVASGTTAASIFNKDLP